MGKTATNYSYDIRLVFSVKEYSVLSIYRKLL